MSTHAKNGNAKKIEFEERPKYFLDPLKRQKNKTNKTDDSETWYACLSARL